MALTLPSARPEFAAVDAVYASEIEPYLAAKEGRRREAVLAFTTIVALTAFASTAMALLPSQLPGVHAAALTAMAGAAAGAFVLNRARSDIAGGLLARAASALGFAYLQRPSRPDFCATLAELKLLRDYNREIWEDEVRGVYAGRAFRLIEAHLERETGSGRNRRKQTIFRGQIVEIEHPTRFLGVTAVRRDSGALNRLFRPDARFSRVGLSSPAFERTFEAWSTDQVEAHALLDPLVLERFLELERLYRGRKLRAAFFAGKLVILVETGDRLGMGTMFEPLADPRRVEAVLAEFDAVFDLIDVAVRPVTGRLDGAFHLDAVKGSAAAG